MGAGNVGLVYATWSQLNHAPFRVLVYMALRTLDKDEPPMFWGGREELAFALGRAIPEGNDPESIRVRKAAYEAVKDVMKTLKKAGAVTLERPAMTGQNAVYALHLRSGLVGAETPPVMGAETPPQVGAESATGGGSPPTQGEEGGRRSSQGIDGWTDHQPAGVARASEAEKINGHSFDYRGACQYLLTIDGEKRDRLIERATSELGPGAPREKVLIRAANLAYSGSAA